MQTPDSLVKFAVHDIVYNINEGLSPQDATVKVAKALELNVNFIKRAAEAVNVALHYNHFKKHPESKASDFPIVDAQKVAEAVYGGKEKTAGEYRSELFSSFQSPEVTPKFSRYLEDGPHREVYSKLANLKDSKNTMSERGVYEKSANYIRDLKKTAEDKEARMVESQYQVNKTFCDVLKKFASAPEYRSSWDEFESQVYSKHGESSAGYLDLLYKAAGTKEPRGKHDSRYTMFETCKEAQLFDTFLDATKEMQTSKIAHDEAQEQLKSSSDYIKSAFVQRGCELYNIDKVAEEGSLLEQLERKMNSEREKVAAISEEDPINAAIKLKKQAELEKHSEQYKAAADYIDSLQGGIGKDLTSNFGQPSLSATTNKPEDNRERGFMLQELATTDPILAKMPTHKVVDAYQQLLRIAPEISKEKELTRAFLRQAGASQAIDPFQGQQLVQANTALLKQRQLQQGAKPASDSKD